MIKKILNSFFVGTGILLSILFAAGMYMYTSQPLGGGADGAVSTKSKTSTNASVGADISRQILATSTDRTMAVITNLSPNQPLFLSMNADAPAVAQKGLVVATSSSYAITYPNLYVGAVQGILATGAAASSTIAIIEF